jgi:hypothetical protein
MQQSFLTPDRINNSGFQDAMPYLNLQNLSRESSRIFSNKKREYLKGKINELQTKNRKKYIRDF